MKQRDYWLLYQDWPQAWLIHVIGYHKGADDLRVVSSADVEPPDLTEMEYLVWKVHPDSEDFSPEEMLEMLDDEGVDPESLPLIPDEDKGIKPDQVERMIVLDEQEF